MIVAQFYATFFPTFMSRRILAPPVYESHLVKTKIFSLVGELFHVRDSCLIVLKREV